MRFLITGFSGFAGQHLAALLMAEGHEVHATLHRAASRDALAARFPQLAGRLHVADVTDADALAHTVATVRPEGIFHLAAITFVPDTVADPAAAMRVNVLGGLHVFAAVARHAPSCRVLAVGSGDAYGAVRADELPVREDCPFRPLSPYGASKAALDLLGHQWAHGAGLDIIRVRAFNHTGPGQRPDFVCPDFARQLVAMARGERRPVLEVGDLEVVRDFTDVRDVAAAYLAAWQRGTSGEAYNVCSGVGISLRSIVEMLSELVGVRAEIKVASERLRRTSVPVLIGSAEKLAGATGWTPRHALRDTLRAVVDDWREPRATA
jgi:GDP-4-dehydro-6-deoxy-D-mannose reductase